MQLCFASHHDKIISQIKRLLHLHLPTFQTPHLPYLPLKLSIKHPFTSRTSLESLQKRKKGRMIAGKGSCCDDLPPGFRFHPTDEELIMYYLKNQATSKPCPVSIIPEIDIYKFDPWQLPEKAEFGEKEWYFFTPRDRKYPNGVRPNRATVSGYWKATGTDKAIYSGSSYVGVKKALVFYKGKPPKGAKTDWIMHEYRLSDSSRKHTIKQINGSMRLDDWVLCRIYKKKPSVGKQYMEHEMNLMGARRSAGVSDSYSQLEQKPEVVETTDHQQQQQQMLKLSKACSLSQLLELDYLGPISHLLNDNNSSNYTSNYMNMVGNHNQQYHQHNYNVTDTSPGRFQVMMMMNHSQGSEQQPFFVNPPPPMVYEFQ